MVRRPRLHMLYKKQKYAFFIPYMVETHLQYLCFPNVSEAPPHMNNRRDYA